jgi:hypothetical protein
MKKIIISAFIAVAMLSGCDLERFPYDSFATEEVQSDPEGKLDVLLDGCYSQLRAIEERTTRFGEYRADLVRKDKPTTAAYRIHFLFTRVEDNTECNDYWNGCYKVIAQTSEIMKLVNEGKSQDMDQKLGEAYFLRGWMYWNLCRMFGRPYYQSPETNLSVPVINGKPDDLTSYEYPDRSTVKEVYDFAISDFKKAESLLTKDQVIKPSKEGVWAMLAKIYAHMSGTFENPDASYAQLSYEYANKVIQSGKYSLLSRENFMKSNEIAPDDATNTETIFASKVSYADRPTQANQRDLIGGQYARIQETGWAEVNATSIAIDLLNEVGTSDWRRDYGNNSKMVDARAAFIVPDYDKDENGNYKRAFIFVANQYDDSGVHNGFNTKTFDFESAGADGERMSVKDPADGKVYNLTPVDVPNRKYAVNYNGNTYTGYDDARILESTGHPKYYIYKLSMEGGGSAGVHTHSFRVATLPDMHLLRAEANAKLGKYSDALTDLNLIRERSLPGHGYESLNASSAGDLILKERALEFMFSGHRYYDLIRTGRSFQRSFPGWQTDPLRVIQPVDNDIIMFIPTQQVSAWRGKLTQNP